MSVGHPLPVAVATPQGHEVCKVCRDPATPHGRARVRSKYEAVFLRCNRCGFISIANPIWLPEAYASPINVSDTGYVARNLWSAERVRMIVELSRDPAGKFLDYAAGYGLLVRLMRDIGYDFRWADEYCENLFARCFEEPQPLAGTFEAITAFEVLEHLVDPMQTLAELARLSSCLIVSTDLVPEPAPAPTEWWYYGLEHGQHVSFYSSSSLRVIAERLNLHLSTDGVSFHVFTRQPLPPHIFRRIDSRFWRAWVRRTRRRTSKREADHEIAVRQTP
jgi:hypothetical protein